jgi:oligosaccharide translocation protein RFT1
VAFGISAVQFYLLNTIILFATREAIRRSTLRYTAPNQLNGRSAAVYERTVLLNLSWLSVILAIPLCIVVREIFLASAPSFEQENHSNSIQAALISAEYAKCITLYTVASWIELLSEPLYILFQKQQRVRTRVIIDGIAVLIRCIITFVSMILARDQITGEGAGGGLIAFAYGQIAYACLIVIGYFGICLAEMHQFDSIIHSISDLLPQRLPPLTNNGVVESSSLLSSWIDPSLTRLSRELLFQNLQKLCLQEGEKFVLILIPSNENGLAAQGVYGLIQNLGSLVARMLLQPIEEAAFMEFSLGFANVTRQKETEAALKMKQQSNDNNNTKKIETEDNIDSTVDSSAASSAYASGAVHLGVLLHLVSLVGFTLLSFGPAYSYVFLDILYGKRWSSSETGASSMLSFYCVYILFMSLNGITEAFVSATISTNQLRKYNGWLIICSILYLIACALLLPIWGTAGLIAANCFNMSLRIIYSIWFIIQFFKQEKKGNKDNNNNNSISIAFQHMYTLAIPSTMTCIGFIGSFLLTQFSFHLFSITDSHSFKHFAAHIGVGVICLAVIASIIWRVEREFLQQLKTLIQHRKRKHA